MSNPPDDTDVVDLTAVIAEREAWRPPLVSVPGHLSTQRCRHDSHTLALDEKARTLTCTGCETVLDPYAALTIMSRRGDQFDRASRELKQARGRLRRVLDEEKKAKARLKRARKSMPMVEEERAAAVELLGMIADLMPTKDWRNATPAKRVAWLKAHMKRRGLVRDDEHGRGPGRSE